MQPKIKVLNILDQKLITSYCEQDEIDYLELNAPERPCTRIKGFGRRISSMMVFLVLVVAIIERRATSKINGAKFDYWATCQINDLGLQ